jgi:cytochrome c
MTPPSRRRGLPRPVIVGLAVSLALPTGLPLAGAHAATGNPATGAELYRVCAACHSLEPGRHRTGPSLADVVGREAGSEPGFHRYSQALKQSGIVWDQTALDAWITNPSTFVPGNRMRFKGLPDPQARADLIAYLAQAQPAAANEPGGMAAMGGDDLPDLKRLAPEQQVTAIRPCADGYDVTTADGGTENFWETNLRFQTDSSDLGPEPGKPVIVGAGMVGDRASIIFAAPEEISPYIVHGC